MEETTIWRENVLGRGGRAYKEWYDVDLAHDMRQGLSRTRVGARRYLAIVLWLAVSEHSSTAGATRMSGTAGCASTRTRARRGLIFLGEPETASGVRTSSWRENGQGGGGAGT